MVSDARQKSTADKIREFIMAREYKPGERLQEVSLGKRLKVSRTPIREALVVLLQEGLVTYRKNRGYIVREFAMKEVLDSYVVRASIEGLACRLVAENGISDRGRQLMQECLDAGDRMLAGEILDDADLPAWITMNDLYHQTILAESRNTSLQETAARTLSNPFLSSRVVHWHNYRRIYRSHEDHHAIFNAICGRQGARAEAMMREHIYLAIGHIESEYGHLFDPADYQLDEGER